jgi:hypothetical protein
MRTISTSFGTFARQPDCLWMSVRIVGSLPFLITASAIKPRSCRLMRIRSFKPVLEHIKDQLLPDYSFHIAAVSDTRERMKLMMPEVDGVEHL